MRQRLIDWAERGYLPDALLRLGMRRLLAGRLRAERARAGRDPEAALAAWLEHMRAAPVAIHSESADTEHHEVPAGFYRLFLGPHMKYSAGYWPAGVVTLGAAEEAMLALTCERAGLADGQDVLELGCGWGSLTLWMAERYPASRILAVSGSTAQSAYIAGQAEARSLRNVEAHTADMNDFAPAAGGFDRIVSVEMFEHMRNWEALLGRMAEWLRPDGRAFVHVFAHRRYAYPFQVAGAEDWMRAFFFTGAMMPSDDLMLRLQAPLAVERHWVVDGTHYARTLNAWLTGLDTAREAALNVLSAVYECDHDEARVWLQRWRMFLMACAELFAYRAGHEWWVSHYRLVHRPAG